MIFFLNANQDSSLPLLIIMFVIIRGGGVLEMYHTFDLKSHQFHLDRGVIVRNAVGTLFKTQIFFENRGRAEPTLWPSQRGEGTVLLSSVSNVSSVANQLLS